MIRNLWTLMEEIKHGHSLWINDLKLRPAIRLSSLSACVCTNDKDQKQVKTQITLFHYWIFTFQQARNWMLAFACIMWMACSQQQKLYIFYCWMALKCETGWCWNFRLNSGQLLWHTNTDLKSQVLCDAMLCCWASSYWRIKGLYCFHLWSQAVLDCYLPHDTSSYPGGLGSSPVFL